MLNEQECTKILNESKYKFTHDEMLLLKEFVTALALIEFDSYKMKVLSTETGTKLALKKKPPTNNFVSV